MIEQLKLKLKESGYSLTRPRMTVFGALQAPKPKTMRELVESMEGIIDRASVYRTVSLFESLGIANRIQYGWKYRVELSDAFTPHHHHITCNDCQRVVSFDEPPGFKAILDELVARHGFLPDNHNLEIYGLCPQCRLKN